MTTAQAIVQHIEVLPETAQREVLDFVEFIEMKCRVSETRQPDREWSRFSLGSAMRGMEDEQSPYTEADIKQVNP